MAFMEPDVMFGEFYSITNTRKDSFSVPKSVVGEVSDLEDFDMYIEGEAESFELVEGWFARLSASGYMDCTEWMGPYDSEEKAMKQLCENYDIDEDGESIY